MKLIDTHCHLFLEEFDNDRNAVIREAQKAGIIHLLLPNVDTKTIQPLHTLCDQYPEYVSPMMGLHPTSVDGHYTESLRQIEECLANRSYCAIGEIGLDLYWDKTWFKEQQEVFRRQLEWSIELDLPVCIHTREAFREVFDIIYQVGPERLKGVFHSFTGTADDLKEIISFGNFLVGINGVITFKNSGLAEVIKGIDINRLLAETDAPYLAPVPHRGKRNEPAYMIKTVEKMAETLEINPSELAERLVENARNLFRIRV